MSYRCYGNNVSFEVLVGKTITSIDPQMSHGEISEIVFSTDDGQFLMHHEQDCCESVYLDPRDVEGSWSDLIGSPVLMAEVASQDGEGDDDYGTSTWTFYKISTIKGSVFMRWIGSSNGYYSEGMSFSHIVKKAQAA
jgi:hypothetical protein